MNRLAAKALILAPLALGGCGALDAILPFAKATVTRPSGQWQNTTISVQKFAEVVFRDKSGKPLTNDQAKDAGKGELVVDAGDFEEVVYRAGRVRYTSYAKASGAQPFVVERAIEEKEFETLDDAIWKDKFFGIKPTTTTGEALPVFFVQYDQNGKGGKNSFAPTLAKLVKTAPLVTGYFDTLSGDAKLPSGTKQVAYYLTPVGSNLKVAISTLTGNASGEPEEKPWTLKSVSCDLGKGFSAATVAEDGMSFSVALPSSDSTFQLMGLKVGSDVEASWETLLPIRTAGK